MHTSHAHAKGASSADLDVEEGGLTADGVGGARWLTGDEGAGREAFCRDLASLLVPFTVAEGEGLDGASFGGIGEEDRGELLKVVEESRGMAIGDLDSGIPPAAT